MRAVKRIRIYCPILKDTFVALSQGDLSAIERDPAAARMLAIIRAENPLGDFGLYKGVFELSLGIEGFTPTARAAPAAGTAGSSTLSPTAVITTYIDAATDNKPLRTVLERLLAAHPWETPVIEISNEPVLLLEHDAQISK